MEENQVFELLFTIFDYCQYFGNTTNFNYAMIRAAQKGRIEIVKLCKEREQQILIEPCVLQL